MPAELEAAFSKFIDTLYDYRVERTGTHYVEQLIRSNDSKTESNITLASITGLNTYVVNTLIRQMLIEKMNALSEERLRDNSGEYIEQQVF